MKRYAKVLAVAILLAMAGSQAGCDKNEVVTVPEPEAVVGKRSTTQGLGKQLAADPDFRALRKLLHSADQKARLKYIAGASIKRDLAFAKAVEKKKALSASDKARLAKIRELSEQEIERVHDLRERIVAHFPEILTLTEEELQETLIGAGVGQDAFLSKAETSCSECYYNYNSCVADAEFRHAIEVITCSLLIESFWGGMACYMGSMTKYMWAISSCSQRRQYCLSGNGCLNVGGADTN